MPCRVEIHAIFARKLVTRRGIAGNLMNGRRKTLTRNPCSAKSRPSILCYNFRKEGHISQNVEEKGKTRKEKEWRFWRREDSGYG